jgi:hypothetical protein
MGPEQNDDCDGFSVRVLLIQRLAAFETVELDCPLFHICLSFGPWEKLDLCNDSAVAAVSSWACIRDRNLQTAVFVGVFSLLRPSSG